MSTATLWRTLAAVFTLAIILIGALVAWNLLRPAGPVSTETQRQSFSQPLTRIVFVDFEASDVSATGDSPSLEVVRELRWMGKDKPRYSESWEGDTLRIGHNCGDVDDDECSVGYRVRLPAGTHVEVETSSGDVAVTAVSGRIALNTVSGDVKLIRVSGDSTIRTVSGSVSTSELGTQSLRVTTTSGDADLALSAAPRQIVAQTTSGDITVRVPRGDGYQVKVTTVSGNRQVDVDQSAAATRGISAQTTSGDVTIGYA